MRALLELEYKTSDASAALLSAAAATNRIVQCAAIAGMRICPSPMVTNYLWQVLAGKDALFRRTAYDSLQCIEPVSVKTVALPGEAVQVRYGASPRWENDSFLYEYFHKRD